MVSLLREIVCDTCDDNGVVLAKSGDGWVTVACPHCAAGDAKRQASLNRAFELARIPVDYQEFTFESFAALGMMNGKRLAYRAARHFASNCGDFFSLNDLGGEREGGDVPRNKLVLTGDNGVGKTGLAVSIVNELVLQGVQAVYIRLGDMFKELQATYASDYQGPSFAEKMYMLIHAPMLIIDEFEVNNYTPDRLDLVEQVTRGRHSNGKPLVATTNLTTSQFFDLWGRRTGDVMLTAHWIEVKGMKLRNTVRRMESD